MQVFALFLRRNVRPAVLTVLAAAIFLSAQAFGLRPAAAEIGSWLVFDLKSGRVLSQSGAYRPWYPASLTKLMTAYVTFSAIRAGRLKLTSPVVVSQNARNEPPSKMGFPVGTVMTIDAALKMVIVKSANDIAVALGEAVAGGEKAFVGQMNKAAREIGMRQTRWANPNGLPDNSMVTSARDLALLSRALLTKFPEYRGYYRIQAIQHGKRTLRSYNPLLGRIKGVNGMKTGYICNSGYNLIASATRGGRTIVAVILGARSGLERAVVAKHLVEGGFKSSSGFFSSSGRHTINNLPRPGAIGKLPPDRYCRKVTKPTFEELAARYGTVRGKPQVVLAGVSNPNGLNSGRIIIDQGATRAKKRKKNKKKKPRRDVMALLIGPDLYRTGTIRVHLGLPDGAPGPKPRVTDTGNTYVAGHLLPRPNPLRGGRSVAAAKALIDGAKAGPPSARLAGRPFPRIRPATDVR